MASYTNSYNRDGVVCRNNSTMRAQIAPRPDLDNINKELINGHNKRQNILEMADAIGFVNMMNLFDDMF